ncbi:MAG: signal transduction histidine kinase [Candidatus Aldehydirespiratoraceae bacterium]|jgi:signal transduction histidine kinase
MDRLLPRHEMAAGLELPWDITEKRTALLKKTEVSGVAVVQNLSLEGALISVPGSRKHDIGSRVTVRIGGQQGQVEICRYAESPPGWLSYGTRFVGDATFRSSVNQIVAIARSRSTSDHLAGLDPGLGEPAAVPPVQPDAPKDSQPTRRGRVAFSAMFLSIGLYIAATAGLANFELFTPSLDSRLLAQMVTAGIAALALVTRVPRSAGPARRGWRYLSLSIIVTQGATFAAATGALDSRAVLLFSLAGAPLAILGLVAFENSFSARRAWIAIGLEIMSIVAVISAALWVLVEQIAPGLNRWSSIDLVLVVAALLSYMLLAGLSVALALSSQNRHRAALLCIAAWACISTAKCLLSAIAVIDGSTPSFATQLLALSSLLLLVAASAMSPICGQIQIESDTARADRGFLAILPIAFAGFALGGYRIGLFGEMVAWLALLGLPAAIARIMIMAGEHRDAADRLATELDRSHMRQEELVRAKNDAESARRAQQRFLSRTSHELRTPIHILNGFSELLSLTALDESQTQLIGRVRSAGDHLCEIVADVLDLSQVDQGHFSVKLQPVAIDFLVADIVDQLSPDAESRSALLLQTTSLPQNSAATADPARLRQVLTNLVVNALKYAGGTITIATERDGSDAVIHVVDAGPGIASSDLERIFAPFERLDAGLGEEPGTGLGLSVARSLCESMGGRLSAESGVGIGTRFTVRLPGEWADSVEAADAAGRQPSGGTRSSA